VRGWPALQAEKIPCDSLKDIAKKGAETVEEVKDAAVEKVQSTVTKVMHGAAGVWYRSSGHCMLSLPSIIPVCFRI
jgi:hypothetical protein